MADGDWQRLLSHLGHLGTLAQVGDGRMTLTVDEHTVTVLVAPGDWDDTVGVVWGGNVDGALRDVSRAVRAVGPDDRFLLYENYALHPSPSEETPMQREDRETWQRIEEARRANPDAELGWAAERPDGSRSRFPETPG